ncbi:MAG: esterase [Rhizobiales bacterium PAR1]|nr:MAG: esterase [Rhizobiales bacterium PAR1]
MVNKRTGFQWAKQMLLASALVLGVGACASPDSGYLVALDDTAKVVKTRTLIAITTRTPADADKPGEIFSGERGQQLRIVSLTLSMPPNRAAGTLPAHADKPDPEKHIALVSAKELTPDQFKVVLKTALFAKKRALVFTHGFNTQFDDAVIRFAQIVEDTDFTGIPVLFSWPSRGSVTDYGYDKDSANFSRDGMETVLTTLAREPNIGGVDIFAHSMGNWLTLETLRQVAIAKDQKTLDRLGTVVLAAPDVDMDVFRTQVARLGALRNRIVLYASRDDHALQASRRLFGDKIRAGENTDLAQFKELGIEAHDLSDVKGGMGKNHGKIFGDAATIAQIGSTMAHGSVRTGATMGNPISSGISLIGRSVSAVGDAIAPGIRR